MAFVIPVTDSRPYSLAYAELYLTLPAIVLRIIDRLELFETTKADVEYDHDNFVPAPKAGSKGVRVLMT